ncbi:MAG: hypothetical protein IPL84_18460 [Chitinophagaceae bacterium]|nr:hypothetical protein [Chitinophagaceae bacterium]
MENKIRITLPSKFSEVLVNLPEQGMGYQIVDVLLKNGNWLKKKIVLDSSILTLDEGEIIKVKEIELIKLHSK